MSEVVFSLSKVLGRVCEAVKYLIESVIFGYPVFFCAILFS